MRLLSAAFLLLFLVPALAGCLGGSSKGDDSATDSTDETTPIGPLRAEFDFSPANPGVGEPVRFRDRSQAPAGAAITRAWDFGDGHGSTEASPTHTFSASGVFRVALRVRIDAQQQSNVTHLVPVHEAKDPGKEPPVPGVGEYLQFGEPTTVSTTTGFEPSLAIDSKGRIYVEPIRQLYRSDDEGKTFQQTAYPMAPISGDSHVVVDGNDRVWVADLEAIGVGVTGATLSTSVWTSENQGNSWSAGNPVASDSLPNDRPWLAVTSGGTGYVFARECTIFIPLPPACAAPEGIMAKTTTAGLTWTPLPKLFSWFSFPFVDPNDGTLYVVQAINNNIDVAVSTDGGTSFSQTRAAQRTTSPTLWFLQGAVDDAGNAYVVWVDKDSSQYDVWVSFSTNKGANWHAPVRVSSGLGTNVMPWLAAGGDGRVVVVWYGTDEVGTPDGVSDAAEWSVYAAQSINARDEAPVFRQARVSSTMHVGPICSMGLGCDSADRDLGDFFSVDLMPDGRAVIAYGEDGEGSTSKLQTIVQVGGPLSR